MSETIEATNLRKMKKELAYAIPDPAGGRTGIRLQAALCALELLEP